MPWPPNTHGTAITSIWPVNAYSLARWPSLTRGIRAVNGRGVRRTSGIICMFPCVILLAAAPALGQGCDKDIDCKGVRICVDGTCVDPPSDGSSPAFEPGPTDGGPHDRGWKMAAGIAGVTTAFLVIPLAAGAVASVGRSTDEGLAFGGAATVAALIGVPITALGANSGSEKADTGLQAVGWIAYGLTIVTAGALLGLGAAEEGIEYEPFIISSAALGVISASTMAAAAFLSDASVRRKMSAQARMRPRWSPSIAAVRDRGGDTTPTFGIRVTF